MDASRVAVTVGFQRRCDPAYVALRDQLRSGVLGKPYLVRMVVGDDQPPPASYLSTSGGIFRDQSVQDFDILRWLTGAEVEEVYATGSLRTGFAGFAESEDVDTASVVLRLSDGILATLTASRHSASGYDVRMEVAGSAGMAAVGVEGGPLPGPSPNTPGRARSPYAGFIERFAVAYRAELRQFIDFVAGHSGNQCTVHDALAALLGSRQVTRGAPAGADCRRRRAPGGLIAVQSRSVRRRRSP